MSVTVRTVQSAEMSGRARFERWRERWEGQFFSPAMLDVLRATMAGLSPEQKKQLMDAAPDAYRRVMGRMEGE